MRDWEWTRATPRTPLTPSRCSRPSPKAEAHGTWALLTRRVGLAEAVARVGNGELPIRADRCGNRIALIAWAFFKVRDHVGRGVVRRILVDHGQVSLPDAFDARQLCKPQIGIAF